MPFAAGLSLVLILLAWPAAAQDWAEGSIGLGYSGPQDSAVGFADVTARLPLGDVLGVEIGLFGGAVRGDSPHETYGAVTVTTGAGLLSAGSVRPAYDSFGLSGVESLMPVLAFGEAQVARTRSRLTWGAMYGGDVAWGLRWDSQTGTARWAVSAHRLEGSDLAVGSAAVEWRAEGLVLGAAVETATDGRTGGKLTARGGAGRLAGGIGGYIPSTPGIAKVAEGFLTWEATDRLGLSALVQVPSGGGSSFAVVAAQYALGGGRLAVGVSAEDGEATASIGMDWKF